MPWLINQSWAYIDHCLSVTCDDCLEALRSTTYSGDVAVTNYGHTCISWSVAYQDHTMEEFNNYCRDFGDPGRPWCIVNEPYLSWEYCTFVICPGTVPLLRDLVKRWFLYIYQMTWTLLYMVNAAIIVFIKLDDMLFNIIFPLMGQKP